MLRFSFSLSVLSIFQIGINGAADKIYNRVEYNKMSIQCEFIEFLREIDEKKILLKEKETLLNYKKAELDACIDKIKLEVTNLEQKEKFYMENESHVSENIKTQTNSDLEALRCTCRAMSEVIAYKRRIFRNIKNEYSELKEHLNQLEYKKKMYEKFYIEVFYAKILRENEIA